MYCVLDFTHIRESKSWIFLILLFYFTQINGLQCSSNQDITILHSRKRVSSQATQYRIKMKLEPPGRRAAAYWSTRLYSRACWTDCGTRASSPRQRVLGASPPRSAAWWADCTGPRAAALSGCWVCCSVPSPSRAWRPCSGTTCC